MKSRTSGQYPHARAVSPVTPVAGKMAVFACSLLLFVLVFALFSPSIQYGFVELDDPVYVTGNNLVLPGLTPSTLRNAFATRPADAAIYVPLLWISFMVDVSLFGASPANPSPFHATNVALHAANAVLFFLVLLHLCGLLGRPSDETRDHKSTLLLPFFLSLLWAVHPLRVESVAWITERKDVLSLFFALLSLLAYLRAHSPYGKTGSTSPSLVPPMIGHLCSALSILLAAAALLVKPTIVPFPLLLLLLDLVVLRRPLSFSLVLSKTPWFLLAAAAAAATLSGHAPSVFQYPLSARLGHLPQNIVHYLLLTICPIRLTPLDPRPDYAILPSLFAALLVLSLFLASLRLRRRAPLATLGILWFFLFLIPVSGLSTIPNATVADRFSYVPALGLSIALCPLWSCLSRKVLDGTEAAIPLGRWIPCTLLSAICASFAVLSCRTLPHWRSSATFYDRVRAFSPHSAFVALHDAHAAIASAGDFPSAREIALASLAANPDSPQLNGLLAACIANVDGPQSAMDFFAPLRPDKSFFLGPWAWRMAQLSLGLGHPEDALAYADLAERSLPAIDTLHANIRYLRAAASSTDPADALPHAIAQWMTYERADALAIFRRIVEANPSRPDILANIAWILSTANWSPSPPAEPLAFASRALALVSDPPPPELLDTVAAALANASDYPAAAAAQQRAISLLPPSSPSLPDYQARLALYSRSLPYRNDIGIGW